MSVLNKTHKRGRAYQEDPYAQYRKGGEIKSYKWSKEELEAYLSKPREVVRRK